MSFISIISEGSRSSLKLDISQEPTKFKSSHGDKSRVSITENKNRDYLPRKVIEKTDSFQSVDSLTFKNKKSSLDPVPVKKNEVQKNKSVQKIKSGFSFDDRSVNLSHNIRAFQRPQWASHTDYFSVCLSFTIGITNFPIL